MQSLRNIGILGRLTLLEGSRRQVFHVLMLVAVTLIFSSAALARFDRHVQMKMLNDLCLVCIFAVSAVLAITVTVTGVPGELEQKTVYPVMAKPVRRWEFLCGKYAGAMGTVAFGMGIMAAAFAFLQVFYGGHLDAATFYVLPFLFLEAAVIGAIALWLSTVCSWPLAWFLSLVVCLLGNTKFALRAALESHPQPLPSRLLTDAVFHLLPNLQGFDFKDALVHHLAVPEGYLIQTALYGVCYIAALLALASWTFARREL